MASAPPPDLPQSIVLGTFGGIKNTVTEERLAQGELSRAVNVDIDDAGQLRRRRGTTLRAGGSWHSIETIGGAVVGVCDGMLGFILPGFGFQEVTYVGPDQLCYTSVAGIIYFSGRTVSGKLVGAYPARWGEAGGGEWISPVVTPTDTLGPVAGQQLTAPPHATSIEAYSGRIYLAAGRVLWATELYLYDKVDRTKNFIQTEHDITMVRAVNDGLYVGTTAQLLFLQGTLSQGLKLQVVMDSGVVKGSDVVVPYVKVHPRARTQPLPEGFGPVFMTAAGICVGLDGGEVYNLTQDHVVFPDAQSAAALYREDQGANAYVAVTDSRGGPSANARIGDYVDAEIVRAAQRG